MSRVSSLIGASAICLTMLSACSTAPAVTACPAPDGQLLLPPQPLPQLPDGAMTQQDAVTAWLNDIALFRIQQLSYAQLQQWGRDQCGWPLADDGEAAR
jgi:hypothetical protein